MHAYIVVRNTAKLNSLVGVCVLRVSSKFTEILFVLGLLKKKTYSVLLRTLEQLKMLLGNTPQPKQ